MRLVLDRAHGPLRVARAAASRAHDSPARPCRAGAGSRAAGSPGTRTIGGDVVQLGRSHEVLAVARLQRPVLAVEDDEVPAQVGDELGQRRIGVANEDAEGRPAFAQRALGQVLAHQARAARGGA